MNSRNSKNSSKVVIVGDHGIGKSCFLSRYAHSTFRENLPTTVGVDYHVCDVDVDGTKFRLHVMDTAGQERYRALTRAYYRQAQGIFLVYDCCDMSSLENVKRIWLPDIRRYANKDAKILMIGNKTDKVATARATGIDTEAIQAEAYAFAKQEGITLIETSAKQNSHVDTAFWCIAKELKEQAVSRPRITKTVQVEGRKSIFAEFCNYLSFCSSRSPSS